MNRRGRKRMSREEYCNGGARLVCKRGTALPQAKLNDALVRQIRANTERWTAMQWAGHLGLTRSTIDAVVQYRRWAHVR